jgi:hypothetical protein
MLSAPVAIPPTMLVTLASADAPAPLVPPVSFTFSATSRDKPHRSASRITGRSPAYAIRFRSSNTAETAAGVWETFI